MRYREILDSVTPAQWAELKRRGIPQPRLADWRAGRRLPTRPQALLLADVTGADWVDLAAELTLLEAGEDHRPTLAAVLGRALQASSLAKALQVLLAVIVSGILTTENAYASETYERPTQAEQSLHYRGFIGWIRAGVRRLWARTQENIRRVFSEHVTGLGGPRHAEQAAA